MLSDVSNFNLWMFFVIGILGCALCYIRYNLAAWVVPIVTVICVLFLFKVAEDRRGVEFS